MASMCDASTLPSVRLADLVPHSRFPVRPSMQPLRHMPEPEKAATLDRWMPNVGADPLTDAFSRRMSLMPWRGLRPVAEAERAAVLDALWATPRTDPTVVYVHVPFCRSRCLFCGFFRNPWHRDVSRPFTDLLIREIETRAARRFVAEGPPITAIFLGGGTPTALDGKDIARIVATLKRCLPLAEECEITLEGRPWDATPERIDPAVEAGVNRISLGIQSFDTDVRRRLGRQLSREALHARLAAITGGEATIVADLIYGLPGQTPDIWQADLEAAVATCLDGLDVYALSVFPGGPLARAIEAGKTAPMPTLADRARAYATARVWFESQGWRRLSQAHLGRTAKERSRYNREIKAGATCLAFGPGAGGANATHSWHVESDLARWQAAIETGAETITGLARHPPYRAARVAIGADLEAGRLDLVKVERLAPGLRDTVDPLVSAWTAAGLGHTDAGTFTTTLAGDFWSTVLTAGATAAVEHLKPEKDAI
jgi:anaerobilin synthase